MLKPYRVIAQFRDRQGRVVLPRGEWTPPTQEIADRLVAAKCLRELTLADANPIAPSVQVDEAAPITVDVQTSSDLVEASKIDAPAPITADAPAATGHGWGRGSKRRGK